MDYLKIFFQQSHAPRMRTENENGISWAPTMNSVASITQLSYFK